MTKWMTKSGLELDYRDMSNSHLLSCANLVQRNDNALPFGLVDELSRRSLCGVSFRTRCPVCLAFLSGTGCRGCGLYMFMGGALAAVRIGAAVCDGPECTRAEYIERRDRFTALVVEARAMLSPDCPLDAGPAVLADWCFDRGLVESEKRLRSGTTHYPFVV